MARPLYRKTGWRKRLGSRAARRADGPPEGRVPMPQSSPAPFSHRTKAEGQASP
jgi:hypothetical protein